MVLSCFSLSELVTILLSVLFAKCVAFRFLWLCASILVFIIVSSVQFITICIKFSLYISVTVKSYILSYISLVLFSFSVIMYHVEFQLVVTLFLVCRNQPDCSGSSAVGRGPPAMYRGSPEGTLVSEALFSAPHCTWQRCASPNWLLFFVSVRQYMFYYVSVDFLHH